MRAALSLLCTPKGHHTTVACPNPNPNPLLFPLSLFFTTACEFLEHECLELVIKNMGAEQPISQLPFYMLIETSGSNQEHDEEVGHMTVM